MDQDAFDLLMLMLESHTGALDVIRDKLSHVEERLNHLEETDHVIIRIIKSWQLWAFLLAVYCAKDSSHLKEYLLTLLGG